MKIEFITNSSALATLCDGRTVLFDPWFTDGIYYGSWYNFPPLSNHSRYLNLSPNYIYISHIHFDHCDPATLNNFSRTTEVWIGRFPQNLLEVKLRALGFNNLRIFNFGETNLHDGLKITIFGDFARSSAEVQNEVKYFVDSSLHVVDTNGEAFFNINDNLDITVENAKSLVSQMGSPDVSFVPYAGGGIYPQCFRNYSEEEKITRRNEVRDRYCSHFLRISEALKSKWIVPTAGSYILGGSNYIYTRYLHGATPSQLREIWKNRSLDHSELAILFEGDVLDTATNRIIENDKALYREYSEDDRLEYARIVSKNPRSHELITLPLAFDMNWKHLLKSAREHLWSYQQKLSVFMPWDVSMVLTGITIQPFVFHLDSSEIGSESVSAKENERRGLITFYIDYRLMLMVLLRAANWNNIEIGSLIDVDRRPDKYEPTIHTLMSFFHL